MLRWIVRLIAILVLIDSGWAAAQFDAPLKTETIALGAKPSLHCLTFPDFLLKWESEANGSAVIYILPGKGPWACAATMKGELHFGSWDVVRVKGRYVVMSYAPNAYGSAFKVFDTKRWRYVQADSVRGDFAAVRLDGDTLVLSYRRPYSPECSLYYGMATACWGKTKTDTGLTDAMMPACRGAYETAKKKLNVADITGYPASLVYDAEARIAGGKLTYAVRPGPITCEP